MSSPKHDLHDLAARFAREARSDEIALDKLADDPDVPDDPEADGAQAESSRPPSA